MSHQHYERQPHIYGANPLQYRQGTAVATGKTPPTWAPEWAIGRDYQYTLSEWERDIGRWQAATEVTQERQGPLLSLAVGGAARTVADQIPIDLLRYGGSADLQDGRGATHHTGPEFLVAALKRKFPENPEVEMIKSGLEFLNFRPRPGETLEALLLRFDVMLDKANRTAQLDLSWSFRAWILLSVLRLQPKKWADLLDKLGHRFPHTQQEFQHLCQILLREHNLEDTLRLLQHTQLGNTTPVGQNRWEGQRTYYQDGDLWPSDEYDSPWMDQYTEWGNTYHNTDANDPYEGDQDDDYSSVTDSEQWEQENILDPYPQERLEAEERMGKEDPRYIVQLYWAARRAIRRHRAAMGQFRRRPRKGKGKGKNWRSSGKAKGGSPWSDLTMPSSSLGDTKGQKNKKGQGKNPSKDRGSSYPSYSDVFDTPDDEGDQCAWQQGWDDLSYPAKAVGKGKSKKEGPCHLCGKLGHWKRECPLRNTMGKQNSSVSPSSSTMWTQKNAVEPPSERQVRFYEEVPGAFHALDNISSQPTLQQSQEPEHLLSFGEELPSYECGEPESQVYMTGSEGQEAATPARRYVIEGTLNLGTIPLEGILAEQDGKYVLSLQASMSQQLPTSLIASSVHSMPPSSYERVSESTAVREGSRRYDEAGHAEAAPRHSSHFLRDLFGTDVQISEKPQRQQPNRPSMSPRHQHHPSSQSSLATAVYPEDAYFVQAQDVDECSSTAMVVSSAPLNGEQSCALTTGVRTYRSPKHDKAKSDVMETLLPDTGAVDNLIGMDCARSISRLAQEKGLHCKWSRLLQPKVISGVGGSAQVSEYQLTVDGDMGHMTRIRYSAPVVGGQSSGVPALLGLREMANTHCVILPRSQQLKIVPNEHDIQWPDGTRTVHMTQAPSGHLLLPFLEKKKREDQTYVGTCFPKTEGTQAVHERTRLHHDLATTDHNHIFADKCVQADSPRFGRTDTLIDEEATWKNSAADSSDVSLVASTPRKLKNLWKHEVMREVEEILQRYLLPSARTRTNVYGSNKEGQQFSPRSQLVGLYTPKRHGNHTFYSSVSRSSASITQACHNPT